MVGELANLKVLITRQLESASSLTTKLAELGASIQILPLFSIAVLLQDADLLSIQQQLATANLAICVSKNAARIILPHLQLPNHLAWAAVGPGTAQYMRSFLSGYVCCPSTPPYDSESLINELQSSKLNLSAGKIILFTGAGGNDELQAGLTKTGATVTSIALYKRIRPAISREFFTKFFCSRPGIDIIVITCITSLDNLIYFAGLANINIREYKLLVVSNRIYKYAVKQGFMNVHTANSISEADILSGLVRNYASILNL